MMQYTDTSLLARTLPKIVSLEGNIGAGKSTQMLRLKRKFADDHRVMFVDEPVDEWADHGFLLRMYEDTNMRLSFQLMALSSLACDLLKALTRTPPPELIITERSILGNYKVFAKANLHGDDLKMLTFIFDRFVSLLPTELEIYYIYVKVDTLTLTERIGQRGRGAEVGVPWAYIELLTKLHDEWLDRDERYMLTIDGNGDADSTFVQICECLKVMEL